MDGDIGMTDKDSNGYKQYGLPSYSKQIMLYILCKTLKININYFNYLMSTTVILAENNVILKNFREFYKQVFTGFSLCTFSIKLMTGL